MSKEEILKELKKNASPKNVLGMKRFGIQGKKMLGISVTFLRKFAKKIPKDHKLALELWETGIHEARMLSTMIDELEKVTQKQMDKWVNDFDSWDICDGACMNLFCKTADVKKKILKYAKSEKEFVRRTAFTLIACLAFKSKETKDIEFEEYFDLIKKYSGDERNFVKKAVNWALRQIGKRNKKLLKKAIKIAKEIKETNTKAGRWIASNAISELNKYLDKK